MRKLPPTHLVGGGRECNWRRHGAAGRVWPWLVVLLLEVEAVESAGPGFEDLLRRTGKKERRVIE